MGYFHGTMLLNYPKNVPHVLDMYWLFTQAAKDIGLVGLLLLGQFNRGFAATCFPNLL